MFHPASLDPNTWRTIALCFVALGQSMFVLVYMTFPWYRTFLGRALFYKAGVLAVLIDTGLMARLNPRLLEWDVLFIGLYAMLAVAVWWQFLAFLLVRYRGKQGDSESHTHVYIHDGWGPSSERPDPR